MDSVIECRKVFYDDIMNKFLERRDNSKYTATGKFFDIGGTVDRALCNYKSGGEPINSGCNGEYDNGNGSLMRILPFVYYGKMHDYSTIEMVNFIGDASSLTHGHEVSKLGCLIYAYYVWLLLDGYDKYLALEKTLEIEYDKYYGEYAISKYKRIFLEDFKDLNENKIYSDGYIVNTLEASLWCFLQSNSYDEGVLRAVNLGSDTDTVAAITGSFCGIKYGINDKWLSKLQSREYIEDLSIKFLDVIR